MKKRRVTVHHEQGLHTRPAVFLVKLASSFKSDIRLKNIRIDVEVDAKSMIGILMLEAAKDTVLELIIDGEDEELAIEKLANLIENKTEGEKEAVEKNDKGLLGKIKSIFTD